MDTETYFRESVIHQQTRILKSKLDRAKELEGQTFDPEKYVDPAFCIIDNKFTTEIHVNIEKNRREDAFGNIAVDLACSKCNQVKSPFYIKWVGIPKPTNIDAYRMVAIKENLQKIVKKTKSQFILDAIGNIEEALKVNE